MSLTQSLQDDCENLGSKIILSQNLNDGEESQDPLTFNTSTATTNNDSHLFLRVGRPGKLYLQPNYTAFTKTSLGSIPSKVEKTLLKTDDNTTISISFINPTANDISKNSSSSSEFTTYKDPRSYTTSYSKKGYGVGFVSKVERFDNEYKNLKPGPGDYFPEKLFTVENDVRKSDLGKSLFLNKTSKSLELIQNLNNNKFYTSQEILNNIINKKAGNDVDKLNNLSERGSYYFESNVKKFQDGFFAVKNKNPGPGKYFIDTDYKIKNIDKTSPSFMKPQEKLVSPIKYFDLNSNDKKKIGFSLFDKNKNGHLATFWNHYPALGYSYDYGKLTTKKRANTNLKKKKKDNIIDIPDYQNYKDFKRFTVFSNRTKKFNKSAEKENLKPISEEKDILNKEIMNDLLKYKRKDLLGLASPRWDEGIYHDNMTHFQVPGPAYYDPKSQSLKRSFNLNTKDFIYTNSVPYKTVGGNIPKNTNNDI